MVKNYENNIIINSDVKTILNALTSRIDKWWSSYFSGKSSNPGNEFKVKFGSSYKKIMIKEVLSEGIIWEVINSFINIKDISINNEWDGTQIIWNVQSLENGKSSLSITHIGLHKELECYEACNIGWATYLLSIKQLIESGQGNPY